MREHEPKRRLRARLVVAEGVVLFRLPYSRELGPTATNQTDTRYTAQNALSTASATETRARDSRLDVECVLLSRKRMPASFLCSGNAELTSDGSPFGDPRLNSRGERMRVTLREQNADKL